MKEISSPCPNDDFNEYSDEEEEKRPLFYSIQSLSDIEIFSLQQEKRKEEIEKKIEKRISQKDRCKSYLEEDEYKVDYCSLLNYILIHWKEILFE